MILRSLTLLALVAVVCACATHAMTSGRVVIRNANGEVTVDIDERDRALIAAYYDKHRKRLAPELAKRNGGLPPGLAKRDRLPPGLGGEPLPAELERQLSPLADGYVRLRIGRDVVLMDARTRVILDVVQDVAP